MSDKNYNSRKKKKEGIYLRFLKVANFVTRQSLPMYSHPKSPHIYCLPQLISCVLLKIYMKNISYRDLEELLLSWTDIRKVLGLRTVPNYSTLNRANNRISNNRIHKILEKILEIIDIRRNRSLFLLFACDSTGFKEDIASFYYALRSGKKRRGWIKVFYLLDTKTQICVSQIVTRGPGGDAPYLCRLEEKSLVRGVITIEVMDRGFDGSGNMNFRFGLPIRIIPPIRRGGSIKGWKRILAHMVYLLAKGIGIYGKRWVCETMNSVIKRKFGDSIRERKEKNKKRIASLMAIVYDIHVIVRGERENRFFVIAFFFL